MTKAQFSEKINGMLTDSGREEDIKTVKHLILKTTKNESKNESKN